MVTYFQHKTQNTKTISETFKDAIIRFDSEKDLTNSKLKKLRSLNTIPNESRFKAAYDKEKAKENSGLDEFKQACNEIYNSNFTKKDSEIFKDFQDYCARTNKDKIGESEWATDAANWKTRFDKLKAATTKPSSDSLKQIATGTSTKGDELKEWCETKANEIFEGNDSLDFKDAQASCGKTD